MKVKVTNSNTTNFRLENKTNPISPFASLRSELILTLLQSVIYWARESIHKHEEERNSETHITRFHRNQESTATKFP